MNLRESLDSLRENLSLSSQSAQRLAQRVVQTCDFESGVFVLSGKRP